MSGVPSFTAGELAAVITATSLARDVTRAVLVYAPAEGIEDVDNDLTSALHKLAAMSDQLITTNDEETPDGAANPV